MAAASTFAFWFLLLYSVDITREKLFSTMEKSIGLAVLKPKFSISTSSWRFLDVWLESTMMEESNFHGVCLFVEFKHNF